MELVNNFSVPTSVDDAWNLLTDISRIGPCLPGATVEPLGDNRYAGAVAVKVGPIKVAYKGLATFRSLDRETREMVLDARGTEDSGKGSAAAVITVGLAPAGPAHTDVKVVTDLQVTGKVAQFGRTAMRDVSGRLIDQFADNLAGLLDSKVDQAAAEPTPRRDDGGTERRAGTAPPAADAVNALALLAGPLKRAAVPTATFALGVLLSALISGFRTARTSARRAAPLGCAHS